MISCPLPISSTSKSCAGQEGLTYSAGLQESTFYKEGERFAAKEFSFKLQGMKGRGSRGEKPQTFAKMEVDMAAYCDCGEPGSRDLIIELRWLSPGA